MINKEFIKKYKLAIITAVIVIVIGVAAVFVLSKVLNRNALKSYTNEYYSFTYDKTWSLKAHDENNIHLKHGGDGKLDIEIVNLENEYKYYSIEDLYKELVYDIESQNTGYNLIAKEEIKVTKNELDGYQVLFENEDEEAMVVLTKQGEKLVIFTYIANNTTFDILLDSVENIIYNFIATEQKFEVGQNIDLPISKIEYEENLEVEKAIKDTKDYDIASKNYLVNYTIPAAFVESSPNTSWGYFNYKDELEKGSMTLQAAVRNCNLYEYVSKDDDFGTIFGDNKSARENKDGSYENFKENLEEINKDRLKYVYRASYDSKGYGTTTYDKIQLVYELDENHIFIIKVEGSNVFVPEKLVQSIKVNSVENYSSFIQKEYIDNKLIGRLKQFTDYSKEELEEVTVKLDSKFNEIDKEQNMWETRYFGLNFIEDMDMYQYEVEYNLTSKLYLDTKNSNLSDRYGEKKEYQKIDDVSINGKNFECYEGGCYRYNTESKEVYYEKSKILVYHLGENRILEIDIKTNGVEISQDIINMLVDFDIKTTKV